MERLAPTPKLKSELKRTVSAWGAPTQAHLARLRIGIVGLGSVGDIIAEALARMGIEDVVLIDFDKVEIHNLDRLLHAIYEDIGKFKVAVTARELRLHATSENFRADEVAKAVTEIEGFKAALDCDLLYSAVDRPWGRAALNFIAYAHLIPVVDGGVSVRTSRHNELRGADWKAHTVAPHRRCLECLGQYSPGDVALERDGFLDDPNYIKGLPAGSHLRRNENVFAFAMGAAQLQLMQMLSFVVAPSGISDVGAQNFHMVTGEMDRIDFGGCNSRCPYPELLAAGDACPIVVTGPRPRKHQSEAA
jgi:hypothetical protein